MLKTGMKCKYCSRKDSDLKRCTRCFSVYYCSRTCQSIDWPEHKNTCLQNSYQPPNKRTNTVGGLSTLDQNTRLNERGKPSTHGTQKGFIAGQQNEPLSKGTELLSGKTKTYSNTSKNDQPKSTTVNTETLELENNTDSFKNGLDGVHVAEKETVESAMTAEYYENSEEPISTTIKAEAVMKNEEIDESKSKTSDVHLEGATAMGDESAGANEMTFQELPNEDMPSTLPTSAVSSNERNNQLSTKDKTDPQVETHCCSRCRISECSQKCSRCKEAFYCSKICQRADWPTHKSICQRKFTEEEKRLIEERQRDKKDARDKLENESRFTINVDNFLGGGNRFFAMLTPEQALINEARPPGSLEKAVRIARMFYPLQQVITSFRDIPPEPIFPMQMLMMSMRMPCVLVAFMSKYHEHVMRHGVYLKDDLDNESRVEFYLDHYFDNPFPFFTYAQVKPGNYICLENPVWHFFMDGTVGIRINDPEEVHIIDKKLLK